MNLWSITTCMGRLHHLKESLPVLDKIPDLQPLVVDYSCPQNTKEWIDEHHPRCKSIKVKGDKHLTFHKSRALNAGISYSKENGATHIIFVDADVILNQHIVPWIKQKISSNNFIIPDNLLNIIDSYGFLVAPIDKLYEAGLFNENIHNYGVEDMDMRMRLHYKVGLFYLKIPFKIGNIIQHSDQLREKYYSKSIKESNIENMVILNQEFKEFTGKSLGEISKNKEGLENLRKLIFH